MKNNHRRGDYEKNNHMRCKVARQVIHRMLDTIDVETMKALEETLLIMYYWEMSERTVMSHAWILKPGGMSGARKGEFNSAGNGKERGKGVYRGEKKQVVSPGIDDGRIQRMIRETMNERKIAISSSSLKINDRNERRSYVQVATPTSARDLTPPCGASVHIWRGLLQLGEDLMQKWLAPLTVKYQ